MTAKRRLSATVHVVDRSAHLVPVSASATVLVEVGEGRAWPRSGRHRRVRPGLHPDEVATVALDGALRLGLAARPIEVAVTGEGRMSLVEDVRRRLNCDLGPIGLLVVGLWLGEVGDPTGHLGHWADVRGAVVAAGARVQVAVADRDASVVEHALAAQSWAAWEVAGLAREGARAQVGAAAARADLGLAHETFIPRLCQPKQPAVRLFFDDEHCQAGDRSGGGR